MSDRSRRDALKIAAATLPVLPVLNAQEGHQHHAQTAASDKKKSIKAYTPKALNADEFETLAQLVDLIIPRTETPGARDAGVHISLDRQAAVNRRLREDFRKGLSDLDKDAQKEHKQPFRRLTESQQVAILTPISKEAGVFWRAVKDNAIDAYYSSEEGLTQELQWNANTFVADFKGCTHKEHKS